MASLPLMPSPSSLELGLDGLRRQFLSTEPPTNTYQYTLTQQQINVALLFPGMSKHVTKKILTDNPDQLNRKGSIGRTGVR